MSSEMEIKSMLIDNYKFLRRLHKIAEKEGSTEIIKEIDEEIEFIKLKLNPLELPDV